jgi:hypothetical protein
MRVHSSELIDGTPLTAAEKKEHADLERHLKGRERVTPRLKQMLFRAEALRSRAIFSMVLEAERAKLAALEARQQPSRGRRLTGIAA